MWRYSSKDWKWPWLYGFEQFERCRPLWPLWVICHSSCLPKFGYQTLNCPSIRHIASDKISPIFPLCQKNWFCGKAYLDDFYPLLRSKSSSCIHIGIKRISQICWLHHPQNMDKSCKTQLWNEKHNRTFFLGHPVNSCVVMAVAKPCNSTQFHSPPPSSIHLYPAYFSLDSALNNSFNVIRTF